jgi:hypothetical protein
MPKVIGTRVERSLSIYRLLRDKLGMNAAAAAATTGRWERTQRESQIAFMGTFTHKAIESQIDEYKKQSFAKFGMVIAVYPLSKDEDPEDYAKCIEIDTRLFGKVVIGRQNYYFRPQHNEGPSKSMQVRVHRGAVQIHIKGSWWPVSAYLDDVSTHRIYQNSPQDELNRQYCWWRSNGKAFNIMKLPGELRNAIFDCVFPSETRPFPSNWCRKIKRIPTFEHSYTALIRTNRQLRREGGDRFYQTSTFVIDHGHLFSKTLDNRILGERLRHVSLKLTHSAYLNLFHFDREDRTTEPYVARQLREMPNLASLEIKFAAPSISDKNWLEGACQRTVVDMIMNVAWPSIRGLPVNITGYVKDDQKKSIQARVQIERELYGLSLASGNCSSLSEYDAFTSTMMAEEQGGVRLDGRAWDDESDERTEAAWSDLSDEEKNAAVRCVCETKCTKDDWNPAD